MKSRFHAGDLVIYRKSKFSDHPGPRAANVHPAPRGETYSYTVDKFWIVQEVLADGTVVATTRRGKKHYLRPDDPLLKRANWLQRLLYRSRFPSEPTPVVPKRELTLT
ncbi:MAG: hypothetical protein RIK87_19335 [Fuerstiella sp.]